MKHRSTERPPVFSAFRFGWNRDGGYWNTRQEVEVDVSTTMHTGQVEVFMDDPIDASRSFGNLRLSPEDALELAERLVSAAEEVHVR